MQSFEEVGKALDELAEEIPEELFRELNGGIILLPDIRYHQASKDANPLLIVGEYRHEFRRLGRYIVIYYGSFIQCYGMLSPERQREELRRVLLHEFTHHLQSLGGTRGLEIEDDQRLLRYRRQTVSSPSKNKF